MSWRVTFIEGQENSISQSTDAIKLGFVVPDALLKASTRLEIRNLDGQVSRLSKGSELRLIEGPFGLSPEYYGEVALIALAGGRGPKYRTSCWIPAPMDGGADVLIRPHSEKNQDEFLVFRGGISITEFDDNNRPYGICFVGQGEKVTLKFDDGRKGKERYSVVSTVKITNQEYDHFISDYLDPRKWQ